MTPEQALDLLDRAAALAQMPRQDHIAVTQAVQVLRRAITPPADDHDRALQAAKLPHETITKKGNTDGTPTPGPADPDPVGRSAPA